MSLFLILLTAFQKLPTKSLFSSVMILQYRLAGYSSNSSEWRISSSCLRNSLTAEANAAIWEVSSLDLLTSALFNTKYEKLKGQGTYPNDLNNLFQPVL